MAADEANVRSCGYKCGSLPPCAPLALSIVPPQDTADPQYETEKSLARGTLFPGLDLPLGNIVNNDTANVPEAELMAIDFASHDLSLYLDTHPDDKEAFETYRDLLRLAEEGMKRFVQRYGPVSKKDLMNARCYTWLNSPWPWEIRDRRED